MAVPPLDLGTLCHRLSHWRGHLIIRDPLEGHLYVDTRAPVASDPDRPCGYCGLANTSEGHDGCLGTLPGVINACCGHGQVSDAWVVLEDGTRLAGADAVDFQRQHERAVGETGDEVPCGYIAAPVPEKQFTEGGCRARAAKRLPAGWSREGTSYVRRHLNIRLEVPITEDLERDPHTRRRVLLLAETQITKGGR